MSKKILALVLAVLMCTSVVFTLASCGDKEEGKETESATLPAGEGEDEGDDGEEGSTKTELKLEDLWATPADELEGDAKKYYDIYMDTLGDFAKAYVDAKNQVDVSTKYAMMAIAEAKLMESAVMLPLSSNGGNYAISRVAPYSVNYALWGNDNYRYHQALVATEFITTEHRNEMKAKWNELRGSGDYIGWAKDYLKDKGYTLQDEYALGYSSDPQTWDVLATSRAADSEAIVNTYDGLVEYDVEGTLRPALAEKWTKTLDKDGNAVYTFTIRKGQVWVDSQGRKVADLKADDFVAGFQHMMDAAGGLEYLVQGIVANASEYLAGEADFADVGVKAVDDTTLQYTLVGDPTYFMTMLGYGVFAPMSRVYYESQGGKFDIDYDPTADDYTYGTTPNNIAYCGPYVVTNLTQENTIVFSANESYWNKDNINVKTITWKYNDGQDPTKAYKDAVAGTIAGCGLNTSSLELCRTEGLFDKYSYTSSTDATSFMAFYNLNRAAFANVADNTKVVSTQDDAAKKLTTAAMNNVHFRRAISFAADRGAYNACVVGEELKLTSLRNCYTPGNFVTLENDVTVSINGTDKTFKKGTYYGEIMQAQIDADGVKMKVWDPTLEEGAGSSDGFDGWYNPANAMEEMNKAIEELKKDGVNITKETPVQIDLPYFAGSQAYGNRANSYKQSLETALEGLVQVNLIPCDTSGDWYYAGYYTNTGAEANYDMYDVSGWGPDYGDPQTYLDTFLPDGAGYMIKCIGIY